jgi:DNA-binding transcriptional regulator YiaG
MPKKKSAILEAVHETATGLHQAGLIDQTTLREFERLCLSVIEPLHGFIKKTLKTPTKELDIALKRKGNLEAQG